MPAPSRSSSGRSTRVSSPAPAFASWPEARAARSPPSSPDRRLFPTPLPLPEPWQRYYEGRVSTRTRICAVRRPRHYAAEARRFLLDRCNCLQRAVHFGEEANGRDATSRRIDGRPAGGKGPRRDPLQAPRSGSPGCPRLGRGARVTRPGVAAPAQQGRAARAHPAPARGGTRGRRTRPRWRSRRRAYPWSSRPGWRAPRCGPKCGPRG
jgi:hypothetical protein